MGGGEGGHPRLDRGNPLLTQANKPVRIKVATNKVRTRYVEQINVHYEVQSRVCGL